MLGIHLDFRYEAPKFVSEAKYENNTAPSSELSIVKQQLEEIITLKAKNERLKYDLKKSERLRDKMEKKLDSILKNVTKIIC